MKKDYLEALHEVFDEQGITAPNWRLKITSREIIGQSDWAWIYVDVYAPRKRKPCQTRQLAFNFVRNQIDWSKSKFYNL